MMQLGHRRAKGTSDTGGTKKGLEDIGIKKERTGLQNQGSPLGQRSGGRRRGTGGESKFLTSKLKFLGSDDCCLREGSRLILFDSKSQSMSSLYLGQLLIILRGYKQERTLGDEYLLTC
jgi:hypothetical protein